MTKREFYEIIDDITESTPGTVKGGELLADMEGWDSMAVIAFQTVMKQKLDIIMTGKQLMSAKSVDDLLQLLRDHIED